MKKYLESLKKCPLFAEIEEKDLLTMLACLGARVMSFDKKYTVFAEGTAAKYIGILLSGTVQIVRMDYNGNRSIFGNIHPSQAFGEAFSCAGEQLLPVSVIAAEPCEVMLIEASHILHTCSNHCVFHQKLIFNLMKDLAQKTIQFHRKLEVISGRTTRDKLMTYLLSYAKQVGSDSFEIPFDRQELADYLEVDRSGLSVEIGKLRNEGILESNKKQFTLL